MKTNIMMKGWEILTLKGRADKYSETFGCAHINP
jgi:hypothetical protein